MNSNNAQSRPGQMSDRATLQKRHGSDPMVNNHTPNAHPQDMQRLRDGQNLPRSQTSGPAQNYNRPDANDPNWPVPQQGHPQRSMTMPVELDSEPNARNFSRPPQQAQPRQNLQRQGPSQPRGYGEAQHDYRAAQQQQQQTPINTQVGQYNQDQYFSPKSQYQGIGREASIEEEMPNFANSPDDGSLHGDGTLDNQQVPMQPAYHPYGSSAQDELYLPAAQPNLQSSYQSPNPSRSLQKSRSHPNIRGQAQAGAGGAIHEMPGSVPQVPPLPQAHVNSPYVGNAYYEPGRGSSGSQYSNTQYPQRQNSGPPLAQGGWNGYSEQGAYPQPAYGYPPQPNGYYAHENHTSSAPPGPGFAPPQRSMTGQTAAGNNYGPAPFRRRASQDSTYARNAPSYSTPNIHENPDSLPHNPLPARPATANQRPIHPQAFTRLPPSRVHSNPVSTQAQIPPQSNLPPAQKTAAPPITYGELQRLRGVARASPTNSSHQLILAKKLVEASVVLVDDGGRADAKMKAKNRERYLSEACKIVKKLAHSGYPDAMFYLADCYTTGKLGLAPDPKEAFGMYQGAAKAGHANAAYRTAVCCEIGSEQGGGTRKDPLKAIQWYKRAAQLGDVPAMYKLGVILLRGLLGQQQNVAESLSWLKKAAYLADDENPHALHELGQLYSDAGHAQGKIQPNEQYAFNYFRKAAELQYKFAQYRLGKCYEYGLLGCPVEPRCSIAWYSRAAAQGEHEAELSLSGWYLTGCGSILEQSDTEAFLWARKAAVAEPPLPKAMFAMGYFHEVGIGCARSLDEAKRWYTRAACKFSISYLFIIIFQTAE